MKIIKDIFYKEGQALDIYLPDTKSFKVFLYFHGGGLERGSKDSAKHFAPYLTERKIAVVSADYIMYPKAKYPDFLTDSAEAVAWVMKNIGAYGKCEGLYVGGSSAGGYISQMLCFDETWLSAEGIAPSALAGFVHDAGQPTCHFNVLRQRGIDPRRVIIDDSAPIYHIQADRTYPPMLVIVADNDMQNRYEQTLLLVSTLAHFGYSEQVQLKVMPGRHCSYVGAVDEAGSSIFGGIIREFIGKHPKL
jgi:hypothetical protein